MKNAINQEYMRSRNKSLILEYIRQKGPVAKTELAVHLGLSNPTIATFIQELLSENKITHCGIAKSTGGRKSALYRINDEAFGFIGIDLQVDRIIGVLTDFGGQTVLAVELPLKNTDEWSVIETLNSLIHNLTYQSSLPPQRISGIGIGVPGIVNQGGLIEFAPNLKWKNVNLRQLISSSLPLIIENEANGALLGEKTFGVAQNSTNVVYVSVGYGIGCGLLLNGKPYRGQSFHAGEFGHMSLDSHGPPCQCGNFGCWEAYASNSATLQRYTHTTGKTLGSYEEFIDLAVQNDLFAREVLEVAAKYLGIGIANIVNGINPEMIIIGGKIAELKDMVYQPLLKQIKEYCLDKTFSGLRVEFSNLKNQACALGMAGQVMEKTVFTI